VEINQKYAFSIENSNFCGRERFHPSGTRGVAISRHYFKISVCGCGRIPQYFSISVRRMSVRCPLDIRYVTVRCPLDFLVEMQLLGPDH
jgi:hypothetical protein